MDYTYNFYQVLLSFLGTAPYAVIFLCLLALAKLWKAIVIVILGGLTVLFVLPLIMTFTSILTSVFGG